MSDFWAVLVDLYHFLRQSLGGTVIPPALPAPRPSTNNPILLPERPETLLLSKSETVESLPFGMVSVGYVITERTPVFTRPVWAFDTVVATLPYAAKVELMGYQGRFVRVKSALVEGWVLKDGVTNRREEIWPSLTPDTTYLATDPETKRIRAVIGDEFFTAELYIPLRTEEFVTYRLLEQGRKLPWGAPPRPRLAGDWHELLKGAPGIFITIEPKTGSVLEAYDDNETAFLAYVLAVMPDETLRIESVGRISDGEYKLEVVPKSLWQGWRPVFIQTT